MSTSKAEMRVWLEEARRTGATHLVVVCDTFSHEDYPVVVKATENVRAIFDKYDDKNMQRVMEVYALHLDLDSQMNEFRAFHFEDPTGM